MRQNKAISNSNRINTHQCCNEHVTGIHRAMTSNLTVHCHGGWHVRQGERAPFPGYLGPFISGTIWWTAISVDDRIIQRLMSLVTCTPFCDVITSETSFSREYVYNMVLKLVWALQLPHLIFRRFVWFIESVKRILVLEVFTFFGC